MSMQGNRMTLRSYSADQGIKNQKLKKGTFRRIVGFAKPYKVALSIFLLTVVVDAMLVVATPLLLRELIDKGDRKSVV